MIVMGVHVDQLTTALTDMTTETAQKEQEFKAKVTNVINSNPNPRETSLCAMFLFFLCTYLDLFTHRYICNKHIVSLFLCHASLSIALIISLYFLSSLSLSLFILLMSLSLSLSLSLSCLPQLDETPI